MAVIAAFFMVCAGFTMGSVAEAAEAPTLGFVNVDAAIQSCPELKDANAQMEQAQKDIMAEYQQKFAEQSAEMSDADKQALAQKIDAELNRKVNEKRQSLLKPILDKVQRAIKQAADAKEIRQVVNSNTMLYGGVDLTKDVIAIVKGE